MDKYELKTLLLELYENLRNDHSGGDFRLSIETCEAVDRLVEHVKAGY